MQLAQVADAVHGRMLGANVLVDGVTIDSRNDCTGQLFIALKGKHFDAHEFLQQAQQHGAAAVIVERKVETELSCVLVRDSHQALKELAAWWRAQFALPVVAITGSVGKTSVKEMLGSIFAEIGKGLVTHGNMNNEIGAPLTLLRMSTDDMYAILELGMNHAGEISRLTGMVQPTVALITNAAAAHLEGLGSIAAIASAKGEIFEGLSPDGVAVINADDAYTGEWRQLAGSRRIVTFGLTQQADVSASYQLTANGLSMQVKAVDCAFEIDLPLLGKHNAINTLAAIAVARAANINVKAIIAGLSNYRPVAGRLNVTAVGKVTLIDDTYNANPASMQAAIETLAQFQDSTLILGDMAELGGASEQEHLRLGELAAANGIDRLFAVGKFAEFAARHFPGHAEVFAEQGDLLDYLSSKPVNSGAILVKGSRSAKMENVVEHLMQILAAATDNCAHNNQRGMA